MRGLGRRAPLAAVFAVTLLAAGSVAAAAEGGPPGKGHGHGHGHGGGPGKPP